MITRERQEEAFNRLNKKVIKTNLGEDIKIIDGLTYSPEDIVLSGEGLSVLRSLNVKANKLILDELVKVKKIDLNSEKYTKKNDILMCVRNGSKNLIGKNCLINKKLINFTHGAFMTVIRTEEYKYIYSLLNSKIIKREINKDLGATINQITKNNLKNFKYRKHIERKDRDKIANFLTSLDDLIQSQEQYIEALKVQKKGYSQKIFNQELRFEGFEEEWNNSIIGSYVDIIKGLTGVTKENFESENSNSYYVQFKNIHKNKIIKTDLGRIYIKDFSKQNRIYKNDIVVTTSSENLEEVGTTNINKLDMNRLYLNSFSFGLRTTNINPDFLHYLLKSREIRKKIMLKGQGITRINLSPNKFIEIPIQVPLLEEQQKIGSFFSDLEDKINLQEQKLNKLKLKKKYYLNKIFQ